MNVKRINCFNNSNRNSNKNNEWVEIYVSFWRRFCNKRDESFIFSLNFRTNVQKDNVYNWQESTMDSTTMNITTLDSATMNIIDQWRSNFSNEVSHNRKLSREEIGNESGNQ